MTKSKVVDALGVMESGVPLKSSHYDVGDGWELLLTGEELRRPKELRRVAITRVEIKFSTQENLDKFLEIIKESDSRLSRVPDNEVMYDWQNIVAKGLVVRFGVAWYDQEFFAQRRDAYLSKMHEEVFVKFGIKAKDIRVEHVPL